MGSQRFESVLTFQAGSATAFCSLIDEQLVRLQISAPLASKRRPDMAGGKQKSYSDTWVDLSGKPGLPPGVVLFVSDKDGITIEVFQEAAIAITLTRYFPMPAWLQPAAAPPRSKAWEMIAILRS